MCLVAGDQQDLAIDGCTSINGVGEGEPDIAGVRRVQAGVRGIDLISAGSPRSPSMRRPAKSRRQAQHRIR